MLVLSIFFVFVLHQGQQTCFADLLCDELLPWINWLLFLKITTKVCPPLSSSCRPTYPHSDKGFFGKGMGSTFGSCHLLESSCRHQWLAWLRCRRQRRHRVVAAILKECYLHCSKVTKQANLLRCAVTGTRQCSFDYLVAKLCGISRAATCIHARFIAVLSYLKRRPPHPP